MKHLRLFENLNQIYSEETLKHHLQFENELIKSLENYLFWKTGKDPDEYEFNVQKYYFKPNSDLFIITYLDADGRGCLWEIKKHEQVDMYRFLNDPEVFLDANKYNL